MFTIISLNVSADKRGSILSMIYLPMNLAFIVGPLLASFVATEWEVRDVFVVSAAVSFLTLLIFAGSVNRTRPQGVPSAAAD
jgi:MFS family permease